MHVVYLCTEDTLSGGCVNQVIYIHVWGFLCACHILTEELLNGGCLNQGHLYSYLASEDVLNGGGLNQGHLYSYLVSCAQSASVQL